METIFYAALGTMLLMGVTFLFTRFMDSLNKWKHTKKDGKSGWRMDRDTRSQRPVALRIPRYNESFQSKKKESNYRDNMNSHLL